MAATSHAAPKLRRLLKRREFLRAARGERAGRTGFSLQAAGIDAELPGVGFTVTKKAGNSPERNRIKRRLRAAVHTCAQSFQPRHDYVLIGRREALGTPFATLVADLEALLRRVHEPKAKRPGTTEPRGSGNVRQ